MGMSVQVARTTMAKLLVNNSSPIGVPTLRGIRIHRNKRYEQLGIADQIIPWSQCSELSDGWIHIDQGDDDSLPRRVVIFKSKSKRIAIRARRRAMIRAFQSGHKIHRSFGAIRWPEYILPTFLAVSVITGCLLAIRFVPRALDSVYEVTIPEYKHMVVGVEILACAAAILIFGGYSFMAYSLWPRMRPAEIELGINGINALFADGNKSIVSWDDVRAITCSFQTRITAMDRCVFVLPHDLTLSRAVKFLCTIRRERQGRLKESIRRELVRSVVFAITAPIAATLFLAWVLPRDLLQDRAAVLTVLALAILLLTSLYPVSLALPLVDKRYGRKIRGWWKRLQRMTQ